MSYPKVSDVFVMHLLSMGRIVEPTLIALVYFRTQLKEALDRLDEFENLISRVNTARSNILEFESKILTRGEIKIDWGNVRYKDWDGFLTNYCPHNTNADKIVEEMCSNVPTTAWVASGQVSTSSRPVLSVGLGVGSQVDRATLHEIAHLLIADMDQLQSPNFGLKVFDTAANPECREDPEFKVSLDLELEVLYLEDYLHVFFQTGTRGYYPAEKPENYDPIKYRLGIHNMNRKELMDLIHAKMAIRFSETATGQSTTHE